MAAVFPSLEFPLGMASRGPDSRAFFLEERRLLTLVDASLGQALLCFFPRVILPSPRTTPPGRRYRHPGTFLNPPGTAFLGQPW